MKYVTGKIGIVGVLSSHDTRRLRERVHQLAKPPEHALQLLGEEDKGHVTLYHGQIKGAPLELVRALLEVCRLAQGTPICFTRMTDICGRFAAAQAEAPASQWQLAAVAAAVLSSWRNRRLDAPGAAEGLQRNEQEALCETQLGYAPAIPAVGQARKLHMSAYYLSAPRGISLPFPAPYECTFEEVVMARMCTLGRVDEIMR